MIPVIHLLILIGLFGLSMRCITRNYRSPSSARWFVALTLGVAITLAIGLSALATSDRGQPFQQWLLPGFCLVLVLALARDGKPRTGTVIVLMTGMLGLSHHYRSVVQGDEYLGTERAVAGKGIIEAQRAWHTALTGLYAIQDESTADKTDQTQP